MNTLNNLRGQLVSRLPLLLVLVLIVVNGLFCAVSVMPSWMAYDQLSQEVSTYHSNIDANHTEAANNNDLQVYAAQIDSASTELAQAAASFLTSNQVDDLFNRLYSYASTNDVVISNLQTQQSLQTSEDLPYEIRLFRLQVNGQGEALMHFVTQIREATTASVLIDTLSLSKSETDSTLIMDIRAYISPLAAGNALVQTQPLVTLTPMIVKMTIESSNEIAESTPSIAAPTELIAVPETPSIEGVAIGTSDAAVQPPVLTPPLVPTLMECPGAAPIQFAVGDWVVVDFNEGGALRLMDRVSGGAPYTPRQIYDNQVLHILAGPVCGTWNEANIWHWYIDYEGTRGWVGEGTVEERWLCPLDTPECAD